MGVREKFAIRPVGRWRKADILIIATDKRT